MARKPKIERFNEKILSRFQIYNSLFLTLPYEHIKRTSMLLPLFADHCQKQFELKKNPNEIVKTFFNRFAPELKLDDQQDLLFNFIQYIERQVVLFDAIEDAGFSYVNNMHGRGTLVIINELSNAIAQDDLDRIQKLLVQLGKTPFYKKEKPTPFDEAVSLIWFLENIFYHSASTIYNYIADHIVDSEELNNAIFDFGFWPGGDRDGNPYVTPEITLKTAKRLRFSILRNYYRDLRRLKRKLTFPGVEERVEDLERAVFNALFYPERNTDFSLEHVKSEMNYIYESIKKEHKGLYLEDVKDMIHKLELFGFHFASLDIRQDSRVHRGVFTEIVSHPDIQKHLKNLPANYKDLTEEERCKVLPKLTGDLPPTIFSDEITHQTLESIRAMQLIQETNGERGCNRYIISNCQTLENILELFAMCRISAWENPKVDFIPLFETIPDLETAAEVMDGLFSNPIYQKHLEQRGMKQTVMLGFSDGTKDGGYFMANWSIYKAKEELSELASKYSVRIAFFDGRGGPPARGGGNTHEFYASMGDTIQNDDIQLTVQGQTISSNFGTLDSSQFNLEQLLSSGIESQVFSPGKNNLSDADRSTMNEIAKISYEAYQDFKAHPMFIPYLERMSTLPYYAKTTLVFNSMMSLTKSFFQLTAYMKEDKEFGMFWELIFNEYSLTKKLLLEVSDFKSLMENEAAGKASIKAREEIVQPLLTIQQYALMELQKLKKAKNPDQKQMEVMETMITRSLFGNINASRNSA